MVAPDKLPPVLADPPWLRRPAPASVALEVPDVAPRLAWEDGERDAFLAEIPAPKAPHRGDAEDVLDRILEAVDRKKPYREVDVALISDALAVDLIQEVPNELTVKSAKHLLARLEEKVVGPLIEVAEKRLPSTAMAAALEPIDSPAAALLAARAACGGDPAVRPLDDLRASPWTPSPAERWLLRHPLAACLGLAPIAESAEHPDRDLARAALVFVAASGHGDALDGAIERFGQAPCLERLRPLTSLAALPERPGIDYLPALLGRGQLEQAIALLEDVDDPAAVAPMALWLSEGKQATRGAAERWLRRYAETALATLPDDAPARSTIERGEAGEAVRADQLPENISTAAEAFWDAAALPAPVLRDGGELLAPEHLDHLATMLRFTPIKPAYVGLEQVARACTEASLDAFCVALLDRWSEAGESLTWPLYAAGHLGGPRAAAWVAERARSWTQKKDDPRLSRLGSAALATLGLNGSDVALTHLADLAQGANAGAVRREASAALDSGREGRAVPRSRIEDALVPDFGLGADGSLELDYGSRKYFARFDEQLSRVLLDEEGQPVRALPRGRKTDDPEKVAAAKAALKALEGGVKALAKSTLRRLERAMVEAHRWSPAKWRAHHAEHPLLQHVASHLVWGAWLDDDCVATFRVAEDRSLADVEDEPVTLPDGAKIGLPHPLDLGADLVKAWADVLADYELLQPFEQLARDVHRCPPALSAETELPLEKTDVASGKVFSSRHRGWRIRAGWTLGGDYPTRLPYDDDGRAIHLLERTLPDDHAAWITISPGLVTPKDTPVVDIERVVSGASLGRLSPIAYSELVRDVRYLTA